MHRAGTIPPNCRHSGFTLVELLVVVAIVAVLAGIALPTLVIVRNVVRTSDARSLIQGLTAALEVYAMEDRRHLPPIAETDLSLRTAPAGGAPRALDLLRERGMVWRDAMLGPAEASGRPLIDPWRRPVRYQADTDMDGTADRPAPRTDWNAKGREPFAYAWSLGSPSGRGDAFDADAAQASTWIYQRSSP